MGMKKSLSAKAVVRDLRGGLANSDLMDKYGISEKSLYKILRQLRSAEVVTDTEVLPRIAQLQETERLMVRQSPRFRPKVAIPVSEITDITREFHITDISEKGFKLEGMSCKLGERKHFAVLADKVSDSGSFPVMAECRWVRQDSLENSFEAGYEITEITTLGARELRGLIDSIVEES